MNLEAIYDFKMHSRHRTMLSDALAMKQIFPQSQSSSASYQLPLLGGLQYCYFAAQQIYYTWQIFKLQYKLRGSCS